MSTTVSAWRSAQIHYHDPSGTDTLLLKAVQPLLEDLPNSAYFTRHWLRGPHVRVSVCAEPDPWHGEIRPLIERVIGDYLEWAPSCGHPDYDREVLAHERLAELEQEPGPLLPWHPDNSIQYEPYDQRLHVLGTVAASELLAAFHTATTPLAFGILEGADGCGHRIGIALNLMFATAQLACPPITKGAISYRSHAEGFLANVVDPRGMRQRFDRIYATNRKMLGTSLRVITTGLQTGVHETPFLAGWVPLVEDFTRRVQQLNDTGDLALPKVSSPEQMLARTVTGWTKVSTFHQKLFGNEEIREELNAADWFTVYRAILNYQYLFFGRLGVLPRERFLMCYLAARTVEEEYGVKAPDMFDLKEMS